MSSQAALLASSVQPAAQARSALELKPVRDGAEQKAKERKSTQLQKLLSPWQAAVTMAMPSRQSLKLQLHGCWHLHRPEDHVHDVPLRLLLILLPWPLRL